MSDRYTKQTWINGETVVNATRMNHIEDGIDALDTAVQSIEEQIASGDIGGSGDDEKLQYIGNSFKLEIKTTDEVTDVTTRLSDIVSQMSNGQVAIGSLWFNFTDNEISTMFNANVLYFMCVIYKANAFEWLARIHCASSPLEAYYNHSNTGVNTHGIIGN